MSGEPADGDSSTPPEVDPIPLAEVTHTDGPHAAADADAGLKDTRAHALAERDAAKLRDAAETVTDAAPKRPVKGASRLGLLAVVLGLAACVLCRPSMLPASARFSPTPPAAAGLVLAFLALVGILLGSRARAGLPLLAILFCLTAVSVSAYQGGARDVDSTRHWADGQVEKYRTALDQWKNKVAPAGPGNPTNAPGPIANQSNPAPANPQPLQAPAVVGQPATPANPGKIVSAPATPVDPDAGIGAGTIFDMRPGAVGSSPGIAGHTALPTPPPEPLPVLPSSGGPPPPTVARPANIASMSPRVVSAQAGVQAMQGKVKAAEDDFRAAYAKMNDPAYVAAQAEVDAAERLVEDAKLRSDGFGQPLIDATQQRKAAQEKVARIVNQAMARDATVSARRADLAAAEESLRQAYDAAGRGK